jgi:hypothetical protein
MLLRLRVWRMQELAVASEDSVVALQALGKVGWHAVWQRLASVVCVVFATFDPGVQGSLRAHGMQAAWRYAPVQSATGFCSLS